MGGELRWSRGHRKAVGAASGGRRGDMGRNGSVKRGAAAAAPPSFTVNPADYRLMEEVGYGAHAVVYRALFLPRNQTVAVKCLDLDQLNNNIVSICLVPPSLLSYGFGVGLLLGVLCCLIWREIHWLIGVDPADLVALEIALEFGLSNVLLASRTPGFAST